MLAVARVAGIQAAKQTPNLLPLCHPLLVGSVFVNFRIEDSHVEVEAQVDTVDRTGVEMEALTACSVAALTIYDMCKSIDRSMTIGELALWEKTGGRSGTFRRPAISTTTSCELAEPSARSLTCTDAPPWTERMRGWLGCDGDPGEDSGEARRLIPPAGRPLLGSTTPKAAETSWRFRSS